MVIYSHAYGEFYGDLMVIYSHFHGDLYQWNQKPMICGGYFCLGDFSMVIFQW